LVKEESYDRKGYLKKTKVFNTGKMGKYNIMTGIFVKDVQKEHSTRVTFDEIQLDTGLREGLFHEKNLKRIPR